MMVFIKSACMAKWGFNGTLKKVVRKKIITTAFNYQFSTVN